MCCLSAEVPRQPGLLFGVFQYRGSRIEPPHQGTGAESAPAHPTHHDQQTTRLEWHSIRHTVARRPHDGGQPCCSAAGFQPRRGCGYRGGVSQPGHGLGGLSAARAAAPGCAHQSPPAPLFAFDWPVDWRSKPLSVLGCCAPAGGAGFVGFQHLSLDGRFVGPSFVPTPPRARGAGGHAFHSCRPGIGAGCFGRGLGLGRFGAMGANWRWRGLCVGRLGKLRPGHDPDPTRSKWPR